MITSRASQHGVWGLEVFGVSGRYDVLEVIEVVNGLIVCDMFEVFEVLAVF